MKVVSYKNINEFKYCFKGEKAILGKSLLPPKEFSNKFEVKELVGKVKLFFYYIKFQNKNN